MKKQLLFAALAVASVLAGCSKEEELSQNEGTTPVNFIIGGVGSRTATTLSNGTYTTDFQENDQIGIYATGGATSTNVLYTVTKDASDALALTSTSAIEYTSGTTTNFYAYYPYQTGTNATVTLTVGDQDTAEKFNSYDFVAASATLTTETTATLSFSHKMAMVAVEVTGSIGSTATELTLKNITPELTWTPGSEPVTSTTATTKDIKMWRIEETNNTYVALVPVQTISANTALFETTIGNKVYTFSPNADVSLSANQISKYKITIGETTAMLKVESIGLNLGEWNVYQTVLTNDNNGGLTQTEADVQAEVLLATQTFDDVTITSVTGWTGTSNTWNGWTGTNAVVKVDADDNGSSNNALILNRSTDVSNNWNQCMAYYAIENPTNRLYQITFKAKTDNASTSSISFCVTYTTTGNYAGIYKETDSKFYGVKQFNVPTGDSYTECNAIINLEVYGTTRTTTGECTTQTAESDLSKIHFAFYPNTGTTGVNFYIDDLKIEQIFSIPTTE